MLESSMLEESLITMFTMECIRFDFVNSILWLQEKGYSFTKPVMEAFIRFIKIKDAFCRCDKNIITRKRFDQFKIIIPIMHGIDECDSYKDISIHFK